MQNSLSLKMTTSLPYLTLITPTESQVLELINAQNLAPTHCEIQPTDRRHFRTRSRFTRLCY